MTDVRNIATGSVMSGVVVAGRMHYLVANRFGEPIYVGDNGLTAKAICDDPRYGHPSSLPLLEPPAFDDLFESAPACHPDAQPSVAGDGTVEPAAGSRARRQAPVSIDWPVLGAVMGCAGCCTVWVVGVAITVDAVWQAVFG